MNAHSKFLAFFLLVIVQPYFAQSDSISFKLDGFDKVQIEDVNGQIEIVLGKEFNISILYNRENEKEVDIFKKEDRLMVKVKSEILQSKAKVGVIKVRIEMPEISKLLNYSNADVFISNFVGRYLGVENKKNGNITITGSEVEFLDLKNLGNGNLSAKEIFAKGAVIEKIGNGDVYIHTDSDFKVEMNGNGDVVNYGKGRAKISGQKGTGKVLYRD